MSTNPTDLIDALIGIEESPLQPKPRFSPMQDDEASDCNHETDCHCFDTVNEFGEEI